MGTMHDLLQKVEQAMEKDGLQPNGSVQAELRAYLRKGADYIHALEQEVVQMKEKLEKSSVAGLHEKIDRLIAQGEKSVFKRVFGSDA